MSSYVSLIIPFLLPEIKSLKEKRKTEKKKKYGSSFSSIFFKEQLNQDV